MRIITGLIEGLSAHRHEAIVLGDSRDVELARQCGLTPWGHVGVPAMSPLIARRGLRRVLAPIDSSSDPYAIVHAWSPLAAVLISLVLPHRPRVATLTIGPGRTNADRLLEVHVR